MNKKLGLFLVSIILIVIYAIGRVLSIITYAGNYSFVVNDISDSGQIYVGMFLNFPSFTFFGISCISVSFLGIIQLIVSNNNQYLANNIIYKIIVFIGFITLLILPSFPSDLAQIPHRIFAGTIFITSLISSYFIAFSIKRFRSYFLLVLETITLILYFSVAIYSTYNPLFPTGIFEKTYVFIDLISQILSIYTLSDNTITIPKKKKYRKKR